MKKVIFLWLALLSCSLHINAERIFVKQNAQGLNNGKSWKNAYTDLQLALDKADVGDEIWVAQGKYYTTEGQDRNATFQLKAKLALYGGFKGDETLLEERNWEKHQTILSGNIGDKNSSTDNALHVVSTGEQSLLDGFIVEDGYAMGGRTGGQQGGARTAQLPQSTPKRSSGGRPQTHTTPQSIAQSSNTNAGGGILIFKHSATVRNTTVRNCSAGKGGGVYNMTNTSTRPNSEASSPVFINVKIQHNYAMMRGGGMQNDMGTHPLLINCEFTENECGAKGGALYNDFTCSPILIACHFENNKAHDAAAIGNDGSSSPIIIGTKIINNMVESQGAGLYQGSYNANIRGGGNRPLVINSIVKDNYSTTNGLDNVINWGEDWIDAWQSEIEGFAHAMDHLDAKYEDLLAIAEAVKTMDAARIDEKYTKKIAAYLNSNTKQNRSGQGGHKGFGTTNTLRKTVSIPEEVVYVKAGAKNGDGASWDRALSDLQAAIDLAYANGGGEVWVAAGEYKPTKGSDRDISFVLKEGVAIYGGFSGNETSKEERDFKANVTLLSGNIGNKNKQKDNSYHVVLGSNKAIIDGVTIADGYADGEITNRFGGGLYCWGYESSTIVRNTVFQDNYAEDGGAVFCFADVLSYFERVAFNNNSALLGGAASFRFGSSCELEKCSFTDNTAASRGGAMVINYGADVKINQSSFVHNSTLGNGGAIWVDDQASQYGGTSPIITACVFEGNQAKHYGGAIHNYNIATTEIYKSTFTNNTAQFGKDIANTLRSQVTLSGNVTNDVYDDNSNVNPVRQGQSDNAPKKNNEALSLNDLDFSVTIIGSGSPQYNPERSEPSALINYRGTKILVDMGNGTKTQLQKLGLTGRNAPDALFLTHHHIDHNDEFISLVHDKLMTNKPFFVAGPAPIDEMTQFAAKVYAEDLNYRMSSTGRHFDPDKINAEVKVLNGGESFEYQGLKISTLEVPHSIKTLAYRFDADGQSIVITGDLSYTADLQKLAAGADIMVIDGKTSSGRKAGGNANAQQQMKGSSSAHASIKEIAQMAIESHPDNLVLTHLGTQKVDEGATQETYAGFGFKGQVVPAVDFLTITPEGQTFILQEQESSTRQQSPQGRTGSATQRGNRQSTTANRQQAGQNTAQQGASAMERMDSNGDNKISLAEAKGPMKENFSNFDTNNDGYVTADEIQQRRQGR